MEGVESVDVSKFLWSACPVRAEQTAAINDFPLNAMQGSTDDGLLYNDLLPDLPQPQPRSHSHPHPNPHSRPQAKAKKEADDSLGSIRKEAKAQKANPTLTLTLRKPRP